MSDELKPGDRVRWNSHGGTAEGIIVRKLTSRTHIEGHTVAASADNSEFLVETDEGNRSAHKPEALSKC